MDDTPPYLPDMPVLGPDGLPIRLFGNAIIWHPTRQGVFGVIDKHGVEHWIEVNLGGAVMNRPTADIVAVLRLRGLWGAADRLAELEAEVKRLMVIATDTQLESEITEALNYIPDEYLQGSPPWQQGVRRMLDRLHDLETLDPLQREEKERHYRSIVEDELRTIDALRLPCPTCGGKRNLGAGTRHDRYESDWHGCPDCVDGKMSWEQIVETAKPMTCPNVRGDTTQYCTLNCQHDALRITDPDTGLPMSHERAWKIVAAVFDPGWTPSVAADFLRGIR